MDRESLTGDWGGLRHRLDAAGLKLSGVYTGEVLGNPSGGVRQGAVAEGLLEVDVDGDLETLAGWSGATMHASMLQIHGRGLSSHFVGNQLTVRDIEAAPSTRLWALWLQQSFLADRASIRVGQIPEQDEFAVSALGSYFINSAFGWPPGLSANLPGGGGGAYPLATTGARLKVAIDDRTSWLFGVFDGNPAPSAGDADPQRVDRHGFNFGFRDAPAYFTEFDRTPSPDTTFKLGAWFHSGRFADLRYDDSGQSLASPASTGVAEMHRGDFGLYGIVDHMLWRRPGTDDVGIGIFARQMVAAPDRSPMPYYGDAGLTWKGMLAGRDDDVAGLAVAYGVVSPALADCDRDAIAAGNPTAVRDYEMAVELIYRAQVLPWATLVPDVQYIAHPGIGAGLADQPWRRIPDAVVTGLRLVVKL